MFSFTLKSEEALSYEGGLGAFLELTALPYVPSNAATNEEFRDELIAWLEANGFMPHPDVYVHEVIASVHVTTVYVALRLGE